MKNQTCSTCKKCPPRPNQRTCKECHAKYMRSYMPNRRKTIAQKAYYQGADSLRESLIEIFKAIGKADLSGFTAVEIVSNCAVKVPRGTYEKNLSRNI